VIDAASDCGLLSFDFEGIALPFARLSTEARAAMALANAPPLQLVDEHRRRLDWHTRTHGFLIDIVHKIVQGNA
jgi:putative restriction endonuclease